MSWLENESVRVCGLAGFRVPCRGRLTLHHLLSYGDAQGNDAIQELLAENPPEFTDWICEAHHTHERWAETKEAKRLLWQRKAEEFGEAWMEYVVDGLPWKIRHPELSWKALRG